MEIRVVKYDIAVIRLDSSTTEYGVGVSGKCGPRIVSALSRMSKILADERNGWRAVKSGCVGSLPR